MVSMLEKLPWEVADLIRQQLDTVSMLQLRIASKTCKAKLANAFGRLFAHQVVPLTSTGLARFAEIVSRPETRCGLRTLTFVCLYLHQREPELSDWGSTSSIHSRSDTRAALPRPQAPGLDSLATERWDELVRFDGAVVFVTLADSLTKLRGMELETITLEAKVITRPRGDCIGPEDVNYLAWRRLWARAIQAYRILMTALASSQVQVRGLGLFRNTMKCSIPTNEFVAPLSLMGTERCARVTENIKSLSLSLSTTLPFRRNPRLQDDFFSLQDDDPTPEEVPDSELDAGARLTTVAKFIRGMSQLESLDLHLFRPLGFFKTDATSTTNTTPFEPLLRRVMRKGGFPNLKTLRLQGLPLSKATLHQCISYHPRLQHLKMRNVFLTDIDAVWDEAVMRTMASGRSITKIELSHLWQRAGSVWDAAPGCIPGEEYPVRYGLTFWQVGGARERGLSYTAGDREEPRTIEVTYEPGIQNKVLAWEGDYGKGHKFREENGPLGAFA
ncbi:F-box-like domain-containing protein [Apiospora marii]|uniref:F-box-like domain-containing protein n=1 Tax=Apiospora marii TaxID=335849 RepID=A0ABR1R0Q6_9PEZI